MTKTETGNRLSLTPKARKAPSAAALAKTTTREAARRETHGNLALKNEPEAAEAGGQPTVSALPTDEGRLRREGPPGVVDEAKTTGAGSPTKSPRRARVAAAPPVPIQATPAQVRRTYPLPTAQIGWIEQTSTRFKGSPVRVTNAFLVQLAVDEFIDAPKLDERIRQRLASLLTAEQQEKKTHTIVLLAHQVETLDSIVQRFAASPVRVARQFLVALAIGDLMEATDLDERIARRIRELAPRSLPLGAAVD